MCLPSFIFSFYPGQISFPADHLFYYAICHFPPMLQDYPPNVLYIVIFSLYSLYCKNDTSLVSIHMNISLNSISSIYCKNGTSHSLTFTQYSYDMNIFAEVYDHLLHFCFDKMSLKVKKIIHELPK